MVQDDNAADHRHVEHEKVCSLWMVERLLWPSNSPDLNQIEPCWGWMKREASKHRDFDKKAALQSMWINLWEQQLD